MIRQLSLECYKQINSDGTIGRQQKIILDLLRRFSDGLTREELHGLGGLMYSSTCGRCRELLSQGSIYEEGTRLNKSGKKAKVLKYVG